MSKLDKLFGKTSKPTQQMIVNQAVNFDKECIFIAVPKTGTTSIRSQLKQEGTPLIKNAHLNIIQIRDCLYVYLLKQAVGGNTSFPQNPFRQTQTFA